ncbi:MAG: bactofilin family protein [Rickettsiales bacterium]
MFRKNKKESSGNTPRKGSIPSIVARDMNILGNIIHEEGVIDFDGTLDGNIRCDSLTIRANGVITGEIETNNLQVYGRVNGLIKAKNVVLLEGCHIEGTVMHEQLSIEDGAFIDGTCKRTDKISSSEMLQNDEDMPESTAKMLENIRLIR